MIGKSKHYLTQPFPFETSIKRNCVIILGFGFFIVVFIWIFGLHKWEGIENPLIVMGFGVITMLVMTVTRILQPLLIPQLFREDNWKVWKDIVFHIWTIFLIGTVNLLYANIGGYYSITPATFIRAQFSTIMIGLFPVTFFVLFEHNRLLKKHIAAAEKLNKSIQAQSSSQEESRVFQKSISLSSESGRDRVRIKLGDLLFVKSVENYVEVYWADTQGTKKALLRSSLKRMEEDLNIYSSLFRCHRAYLVNLKNIDRVSGNSQGYQLILKGFDKRIPVSRRYSKAFRQAAV